MKWLIGITLYPDKSYIEVSGKMINTTKNTNSFLYWSNVATHVNEHYQIIFPENTHFGVYHAKNSFCHWPVTKETFVEKSFYKENIDASWWKNHRDPISIFGYDLKGDFIAGYDHGKEAGTMLVGNSNIVKGGKLWQWGPGAYGAMWDTIVLTDRDGPYAELMVGAYSDNQPDYSWINPYEVKTFKKYWYGIRDMKGVKTANENASLNFIYSSGNKAFLAVNTTQVMKKARIKVFSNSGEIVYQTQTDIAPDLPFKNTVQLRISDIEGLKMILETETGDEVLSYQHIKREEHLPLPETVTPPESPENIKTIEELYLTGVRNKQFHNAFIDPVKYFEEALKRDPYESRCNTQLGIYYRECGDYDKAVYYLRQAIKRLTKDYTRPADSEALYNLGLILQETGQIEEAVDTLYRAAWNQAFASPAYYHLAQISVKNRKYLLALEQLEHSLLSNALNPDAQNLKISVLIELKQYNEAEKWIEKHLTEDPLNFYALNERYRIFKILDHPQKNDISVQLNKFMRDNPETYLELAVKYMNNSFHKEAIEILKRAELSSNQRLNTYPTIYYYLGYLNHLIEDKIEAKDYFLKAISLPIDFCFPFRLETDHVYDTAIFYFPESANTYYYWGNLLYNKQPGKAINYWEQAVKYNPSFSLAYRNLGWAYRHHIKDYNQAITHYEKAIDKDCSQAIYFTELDELYELNGTSVFKRHEILTKNHQTVVKRYDSFVREIRMLIQHGEYDKALSYLTNHFFSRQEGINDLHDIYVDACLQAGLEQMGKTQYLLAEQYFFMADEYPANQFYPREEKYARSAQIYYLTGLLYEEWGKRKNAGKYFAKAIETDTQETIYDYYRALALHKINHKNEINTIFDEMIRSGRKEIAEKVENFFVSFGPGKTLAQVNADAYFKIALGYLGKGESAKSKEYFEKTILTKPDYLWGKYYLNTIN
jgi:tetratricopeptide (TPR) repeat protein